VYLNKKNLVVTNEVFLLKLNHNKLPRVQIWFLRL